MTDPRGDSRSWLSALLAPASVDEFLSNYWLRQHLFCRGAPDRFTSLLSWTELNRILEQHWRETFRFRLALQGRDLEPSTYADLEGFTPRIRSKDVTNHLRRGATLSFDAYPGLELKGRVASIGAGTGSEFSVLPAQNANGNWVKVTQRVPVRIAIDSKSARPLIAGLSTHVSIDTSR